MFSFLFSQCSEKKCAHLLRYNVQFISRKRAVELDPYVISHGSVLILFSKYYLVKTDDSLEM